MKGQVGVLLTASLIAFGVQANPEKLAIYSQMRAIAAERDALKTETGSESQARMAELQAQFDQLKASMGGDDPTQMNEASSAGAATRAIRGSGPTPPTGMIVTTTSATNAAATAIPTGPAVVTSTIMIAGAGPYLWDLDLTTVIDHTFAADLDITLQSPAGTIVTLTTDNGAGNDNVFNGTFWDDDANPAGQVPYTTNNGLVTDNAYVNLTLASPLAPEEALGAFRGEDPNGTWTITISDDLAGDGGNLTSWTIDAHTLTGAPTLTGPTAFTNNTPTAVPTGPAVVTHTVAVAGLTGVITDMTALLNLTHTFSADVDMTLQSPAGTVVTLSTDNGAGNDNTFNGTSWDDNGNPAGQVPYVTNNGMATDHAYVNLTTATPLAGEEPLSAFTGEDPNGNWVLTISDDLAGDGGSIDSLTLNFTMGTPPCLAIVCPADVTQANDLGQCGAIVNFPAPTGDPGCGTITCVAASGSLFPVGGPTAVNCTSQAGPACSFNVTINDTEPPVATCPADANVAATSAMGAPFNFMATVTDNCPGSTINCVPASGSSFPIGTTLDTCTAADSAMNSANCSFNVNVIAPDLSITKTSSTLGVLQVGQNAIFTITVTNNSAADAAGVVVTDSLIANLAFVSSDCGATAVGQDVTWNVGTVPANGSVSCTLTTTVTVAGPIDNSVTVTSTTFDPDGSDNTARVSILGALIPIPVLNGLGLFALIGLILLVASRRQTQ